MAIFAHTMDQMPAPHVSLYAMHRAEPWEPVAAYLGIDFFLEVHLMNLLLSEGIPMGGGGSKVCGISVPKSLARRARKVLRKAQRPDVYEIVGKKKNLFLSWPKPAHGTKRTFGRPVAEVIAAEPEGSLLAAALREDLATGYAQQLPVLVATEAWDRPYLDSDGKWRTGVYLEVHLTSPVDAPPERRGEFVQRYGVPASGDPVRSYGGIGWGPPSASDWIAQW